MKKVLLLGAAILAALILMGCPTEEEPETPLTITVTDYTLTEGANERVGGGLVNITGPIQGMPTPVAVAAPVVPAQGTSATFEFHLPTDLSQYGWMPNPNEPFATTGSYHIMIVKTLNNVPAATYIYTAGAMPPIPVAYDFTQATGNTIPFSHFTLQ